MLLLKDKHGTKTDSIGTAAANVDTKSLGLGEESIALGSVKSKESSLTLATEVVEGSRVLLGEVLNSLVEVVTNAGGIVDEVKTVDLIDNRSEENGAGRVTHPSVELTVGLIGSNGRVAVVEAGSLSLL